MLCREGRWLLFFVTGPLVGITLGLRFKVLVLIPAILFSTVVIIISESGDKLSMVVLTVVRTVVSLQMGYIAGCILQFLARAYDAERIGQVFGEHRGFGGIRRETQDADPTGHAFSDKHVAVGRHAKRARADRG